MKCKYCGKRFTPGTYNQVYCSAKCKWTYNNKRPNRMPPNVRFKCKACGETVEKYIIPSAMIKAGGSRATAEYCNRTCAGKKRRGKLHPNWKGGRVDASGYVIVHCPWHPAVSHTRRKYLYEHRLVMEKHLGRYLRRGEVVHHKNDKGNDNRLANLILCKNQAEHKRLHESGRTRNKKGRYVKKQRAKPNH